MEDPHSPPPTPAQPVDPVDPADPANPAPAGDSGAESSPGYFNQSQLEEIALAEDVLAAGEDDKFAAALDGEGITADYLKTFAGRIAEARRRSTATGQTRDSARAATTHATGTQLALVEALQGLQSAARQKARMAQDPDDPTEPFTTDGYLIGERLNPSRAALLQNADTLLAKATADQLPGYPAAKLTKVAETIQAYRDDKTEQAGAQQTQESTRIDRDALLRRITSRRLAIQHAADRLWPYTRPVNRPIRKLFGLPLSRPMSR